MIDFQETFAKNKCLISFLNRQNQAGLYIGAICASPAIVLAPHGFLKGHTATCYPSMISKLPNQSKALLRVVVSGNISNNC